MHLTFPDEIQALEYAEIHAKRDEYPFCYDRTNKVDMAQFREIEQEAVSLRSYNADVAGKSYILGNYKIE